MPRHRINVNGIVQGVGFRPFVYRLSRDLNLSGWVSNDSSGVIIEIEGRSAELDLFASRLTTENPPISLIKSICTKSIPTINETTFQIVISNKDHTPTTLISPDIATCDDCLAELFDPSNRRYHYPFINCTNCGPRYTIVKGIPYDRPLTSMKKFTMCQSCQSEYDNPDDRRFHAQPNGCAECGPTLSLHDGTDFSKADDLIIKATELLRAGKIIAVKGIGGFHLCVDPANEAAVKELRQRKGRAEKPLAVMARSVDVIKQFCHVSTEEEKELLSYQRPIVLLKKLPNAKTAEIKPLPETVAPGNHYYGFMLPYTPMHHLLMEQFDLLVMTSANLSEEPIAIDNDEAVDRLKNIADYFIFHNRDILQRCDDSIIRISKNQKQVIRRSRGYVPHPVFVDDTIKSGILAVGGELKNSIALSRTDAVFLSQYIGDLDNPLAFEFFTDSINHLSKILEIKPKLIVCDRHPEYLSTKWAKEQNLPVTEVQHHHAHMVSVMAENNYSGEAIGIILDGTGYGTDGTIWGGEILLGNSKSFERKNWLKPVPMPGGTMAIKQPWRMALSYLKQTFGDDLPDIPFVRNLKDSVINIIYDMIDKNINSPMTSSCGRLFDAVSAILNIKTENNYDAQAAIELEVAASAGTPDLPLRTITDNSESIDTTVLIKEIVNKIEQATPEADIALWFHHKLAELFISSVSNIRETDKVETVALSGGVFQNQIFFEYLYNRLQAEKFKVLIHKELPSNDGGLALGQIIIANANLK